MPENKEKRASFKKSLDKPILPKNQFGQTIIGQNNSAEEYIDINQMEFDIQDGVQVKASATSIVDKLAQKLITNGRLTELQKKELEEYLHEANFTDVKVAVKAEGSNVDDVLQDDVDNTNRQKVSNVGMEQSDQDILTKNKADRLIEEIMSIDEESCTEESCTEEGKSNSIIEEQQGESEIYKTTCCNSGCGAKLESNYKFCPKCGQKQLCIFCTECGYKFKGVEKFCPDCGQKRK